MTTSSRPDDGRSVVRVAGDIDIANSVQLRSILEAAARDGVVVEVDMGEATFVDATGLTALLVGRRAAIGHGGSLVLTHVPPFFQRLLEIAALETVLTSVSGSAAGRGS